jgi:transposase, IS5 family
MTTFFMIGVTDKIKNNKIVAIGKIINWNRCLNHLKKIHKRDESLAGGQVPYDRLKMFKSILLQQWHSLSDEQLVEVLSVRVDFMAFTGFELADELPNASTFCRFRNKLIERNLDERLFKEINFQIEKLGLKLEKAQCAIVDATLIESASRPRRTIIIENDREESLDESFNVQIEESKDPDARWVKKGKKFHFGYKGFASVDEEGFYTEIHTESANESEVNKLEKVTKELKAKNLLADKGYASAKNREYLKNIGVKDGIMHKAVINKPLTIEQKLINKVISKNRYRVEQSFGTLKRIFKFERASYRTKRKVQAQFTLKALCSNLLKAVNKAFSSKFMPNYA